MSTSMADASYITKFGHVAVYSKGHQKSRETTREISSVRLLHHQHARYGLDFVFKSVQSNFGSLVMIGQNRKYT